jgi:hypothetical protein
MRSDEIGIGTTGATFLRDGGSPCGRDYGCGGGGDSGGEFDQQREFQNQRVSARSRREI